MTSLLKIVKNVTIMVMIYQEIRRWRIEREYADATTKEEIRYG